MSTVGIFNRLNSQCDVISLEFPSVSQQCMSITDSVLKEISSCTNLERLDISTHRNISDQGVEYISQNCRNLKGFAAEHCVNLSAYTIIHLMSQCPYIEVLNTMFCPDAVFNSERLIILSKYVGNLKSLSIEIGNVSSIDFDDFLKCIPKIETLSIRGFDLVSAKNIHSISKLAKLRRLHLLFTSDVRISSTSIQSNTLEYLSVSNAGLVSNVSIECPALSSIHFSSIGRIERVNFNVPSLKDLKFRACTFDSSDFNLNSVKSLDFFDCTGIPAIKLKSRVLESLSLFMMSDLEEIHLDCPFLRCLTVDLCMNIQSSVVMAPLLDRINWFSLPQLQSPLLKQFSLYSEKLSTLSLQRCINLQHIKIHSSSLSALNIADCRVLENLDLKCLVLQKLALSAPMMDFSVDYISQLASECPEIFMLSLSNIPSLKDHGLKAIVGVWSNLQALIISGCDSVVTPVLTARNLKGLQFIDCLNLQRPELNCQRLCKLFFKNCSNLDHDVLKSSSLPGLKLLDLAGCKGLSHLTISQKELVNLTLNNMQKLVEIRIDTPALKQLQIQNCPLVSQLQCTMNVSLADIQLEECHAMDDRFLESLCAKSPILSSVAVSKNSTLKSPSLHGDNLKSLSFQDCLVLNNVTSTSTILNNLAFKQCPVLKYQNASRHTSYFLELIGCDALDEIFVDSLVSSISLCKNLKSVTFHGNTPKTTCVTNCAALEKISFEGNGSKCQIRDCESFYGLIGTGLTKLSLTNCLKYQDDALESFLAQDNTLDSLSLENCSLLRPSISHPNITKLSIKKCFLLDNLTIDCPLISDLEVTDIPSLENLSLNSTLGCTKLIRLNLRGTRVGSANFDPRRIECSEKDCFGTSVRRIQK